MLALETKSPLGPELFPCTHSSLTPWPLGWYKLACSGSGFLADSRAPMKSKGQCEGRSPPPCVKEASAPWRSASPQPPPGAETYGGL